MQAIASGSWSTPAIWNTGVVPTLSDDVDLGGFNIYADGANQCNSLSDFVGGGQYTCNGAYSLQTTLLTSNSSSIVPLVFVGNTYTLTLLGTVSVVQQNATYPVIQVGSNGTLVFGGRFTITNSGSNPAIEMDGGAIVIGGVSPSASDLRYGVVCGSVTGSCYIPVASSVLFGVNVDATTGTYHGPAASDVRHGVAVGLTTGTAYIPALTDVRYGTNVDAGVGTAHIPASADVRHGTATDATTGTCYVPAAANVLLAVPVDATTGTYAAPTAAQIATVVWQDLVAGSDFTTAGSVGALISADLNAALGTINTNVLSRLAASAITLAGGAVTVGTNEDKTGYALASNGLDSITATAPTGVAATFPQMIVQTWRRFFCKAVNDTSGNTLKTYADDGTTVTTTQTTSTVSSVQTQGAAS